MYFLLRQDVYGLVLLFKDHFDCIHLKVLKVLRIICIVLLKNIGFAQVSLHLYVIFYFPS